MLTRLPLPGLACAVLAALLLPLPARANGYENYPPLLAWSPDSQRLAAVRAHQWPYHGATASGMLNLYDREGALLAELGSGEVGSPCFSSDGRLAAVVGGRLAVFEWDKPSARADAPALRFMDTPQPVLDCAWLDTRLPGDPPQLAFSAGERFYGAAVWRIQLSGAQLTRVSEFGADASAVAPLDDGAGGLLFLHQPGFSGEHAYERLWHAAAAGSPRRLSAPDSGDWPDDYHESNPAVLPDGRIVFQRGGWGDWSLRLLDPASGGEALLLPDAQQPSVSADGRWLAFTRRSAVHKARLEYDWDAVPQVWLADLAEGRLWRVPASVGGAELPALSPDGARLAWVEYADGGVQVRVASVPVVSGAPADGRMQPYANISAALDGPAAAQSTDLSEE